MSSNVNNLMQYLYTDEKYRIKLRELGLAIGKTKNELEQEANITPYKRSMLTEHLDVLNNQYKDIQKKIRGQRCGVMIAIPTEINVLDNNSNVSAYEIRIGFSFLSNRDKWDFIGEKRVPGFGVKLATDRANFLISSPTFKDFLTVEHHIPPYNYFSSRIPMKYAVSIFNFIDRCKRYYKSNDSCKFIFPLWVSAPDSPFNKETPEELLQEISLLV